MDNQTTFDDTMADRQPDTDGEKQPRQTPVSDGLPAESVEGHDVVNEESQHLTGFKLAITMVSLTLVFFLVMLDLSIIATVSRTMGC